MNVARNIFLRILSKAHQRISKDDEENYDEDSSKLFFPRNPELLEELTKVAESAATIYTQKKLVCLLVVYDSVAFCIRFDKECTFKGTNIKLLSSYLDDLPSSTGSPHFVYQTTEEMEGWNINATDFDESDATVEIFPVCDFEHVCIYTARIPGQYINNTPSTSYTTTSAASSSAMQSSMSAQASAGITQKSRIQTQVFTQEMIHKEETNESEYVRSIMNSIAPNEVPITETTEKNDEEITKVAEMDVPDEASIENDADNQKTNEEEDDSDFILGQIPKSQDSEDEEEQSINEEPKMRIVHEERHYIIEEEEEEEQQQEILQNEGTQLQKTPPGFFPKYLSSSEGSSIPSSLLDNQ